MTPTNQPINILILESGSGFGGAVICLAELIKCLDKEKFNPLVVSTHNDTATSQSIRHLVSNRYIYLRKYYRPPKINIAIVRIGRISIILKHVFIFFVLIIENIIEIPFILKLVYIIKKFKVRLLHLNNSISGSIAGIIAAKLTNRSSIVHVRSIELNTFITHFFSRYLNTSIAVSKAVKTGLLNIGVTPERIRVVYDPVDIKNAEAQSMISDKKNILEDLSRGRHTIGLFGCIVDWKGHGVFIEAANAIVHELGRSDISFFIVGDTPSASDALGLQLKNLVNNLGLSEYIFFLGHQNNVYPYMKLMDIVVHASTLPEPFGRVIIEAMAIGKPVVATKMGGPLEIITDGENGILIDANNPKLLAGTIVNLLNNPALLQSISAGAVKTVREKFSPSSFKREIEDIYGRFFS